jgi:hypothetical protein
MGTDEPPTFTLQAVMTALDEDDARDWLDRWQLAPRQLRTLMESDIGAAAVARDRNDPRCRAERRRFWEIVGGSGP